MCKGVGVRERLGEQRIDGAIEKGARRRVEPALVRRLKTKREEKKKGGGEAQATKKRPQAGKKPKRWSEFEGWGRLRCGLGCGHDGQCGRVWVNTAECVRESER